MADVQPRLINQLPAASALTGAEVLPAAQAGLTVGVTAAALAALAVGQVPTPPVVTKESIGLGNVANLAPPNLPVSTATQTALDGKQPLDSDLTAIAALTTTAFGRSLLTLASLGAAQISDSSASGRAVLTGTPAQGATALGVGAASAAAFASISLTGGINIPMGEYYRVNGNKAMTQRSGYTIIADFSGNDIFFVGDTSDPSIYCNQTNHYTAGRDGTLYTQTSPVEHRVNLPIRSRAYTVAALPSPGVAGRQVWASNGRAYNGAGTLEGAGAGTGVLVTDNGTAWKIAGTNQTVQA